MTSPTQPKATPIPAVLVYGTPSSPELTQASWFRAEDKEAAKAAAETLKFSVIDVNTDVEKALTFGVHEGVLKGSGRMIVGSVSPEVYRRIEEYVRKGADASTKSDSIAAAAAKMASEQTVNNSPAAGTSPDGKASAVGASSGPATAPATPPDGKAASTAIPAAASTDKPHNASSTAVANPWDALRVGSSVLAAYWNERGKFEGFWLATVNRIDKGEFTLKWSDAPEYPPFKDRRKNIAILHPEFNVSGK